MKHWLLEIAKWNEWWCTKIKAINNNETTTRCAVWYWKMHTVDASEIRLTSWGWQFLPLFIGFYTSKRWLLGIPAASTVESISQGTSISGGVPRPPSDHVPQAPWATTWGDEDEVKLGGRFLVLGFTGDISHLHSSSLLGVRSKMWGKRTKDQKMWEDFKISVLVGWTTRLNHHFLVHLLRWCFFAPPNKGHIARPAWIIWKALEY